MKEEIKEEVKEETMEALGEKTRQENLNSVPNMKIKKVLHLEKSYDKVQGKALMNLSMIFAWKREKNTKAQVQRQCKINLDSIKCSEKINFPERLKKI